MSQLYDYSTYYGVFMTSTDSGVNWYWPNRDGLFVLYCCEGTGSAAATYETWGYVPTTKPAWYQAWPSILKLCYVAVILMSALFVYRQKPKSQYPGAPDASDIGGPTE